MKFLVLSIFVFSGICFVSAQSPVQTTEMKKQELKQQFNIYEEDHRGLIIYFSDQTAISYPIQQTFPSLDRALEFFFSGGVMKDLVCVSVLQPQSAYPDFKGGEPMDMNSSVENYIKLFKQ